MLRSEIPRYLVKPVPGRSVSLGEIEFHLGAAHATAWPGNGQRHRDPIHRHVLAR